MTRTTLQNVPISKRTQADSNSIKPQKQDILLQNADKQNSSRPTTLVAFLGSGNEFSTAGRTPPILYSVKPNAGKISLNSAFKPSQISNSLESQGQSQGQSQSRASSHPATPVQHQKQQHLDAQPRQFEQKPIRHKQPDWCDDDHSMTELSHKAQIDSDDLWFMRMLFDSNDQPQDKLHSKGVSSVPPPLVYTTRTIATSVISSAAPSVRSKTNTAQKQFGQSSRNTLKDSPPPSTGVAKATSRLNRQRNKISALEKAEIANFVEHLFDEGKNLTNIQKNILKRNIAQNSIGSRNKSSNIKKSLSDFERYEINYFISHLFDGTQKLLPHQRRRQKKLTTEERNEICHFVHHMFDNHIPKTPILLKQAEIENAKRVVFEIWAAAKPGWGTSRHQLGPFPKSERSQRRRRNRQAKKEARERKAYRERRATPSH
ncbi:hypothetical protein HK100_010792 [Physocladia obscura]|uniref:Uncharacterized protein n=1 Tax=Physocladia obscura TaxID=109957 RepID=A0AAD5T3X9_9FUNG|nr:hypothetical protein HK100_010792 [Physocladia obscura]